MKRLLLSASGRRDPPLPGLSINTRFVSRILVYERMVSLTSQVCIGFGAQDLLQSRDSASIRWMGAQPTDSFLSHMFIGIFERHLNEQADEISRKLRGLALLAGR